MIVVRFLYSQHVKQNGPILEPKKYRLWKSFTAKVSDNNPESNAMGEMCGSWRLCYTQYLRYHYKL